jgi:hypothetical protein
MSFFQVGLIEPGSYKLIAELVKGDKKEKIEKLELLSLQVISEGEAEIS